MTLKKDNKIIFAVVVILFLVSFYHVEILPWRIWERNYRMLFILPILVIILNKGKYSFNGLIDKRIVYSYFSLIALNCITCLYFRGQHFNVSLLGWYSFFLLLFVPVFANWRMNLKQWEKTLEILFIIILLGYILQYLFIDVEIFKLDKKREFLEVESRVRIFSDGILFLGALYSLNKFFAKSSKRLFYVILYIVSSFIIFLQGFRMLMLGFVICSVILYFRINGFSKKIIIVIISISFLFSIVQDLPIVRDKIDEIVNRNEKSNFNNDDYVRVILINHFYNNHFINKTELILGSGMTKLSVDETKTELGKTLSQYAKDLSKLAAYYHLYAVDAGLIGLSWEAGIPFTIVYIVLLLSVLFKKVEKEYYYLGMFELMGIIVGITHAFCYWHNNIIYHSIVLVMVAYAHYSYITNKKLVDK